MTETLREAHADLRTLLEPPEVVELASWTHAHVHIASLELVTRPAPAVRLRFSAGELIDAPEPKVWPAGHRTFAELAEQRAAFLGPPEIPAQEVHLDRVRRLRTEYLRELDRTVAYTRPHFAGWAVREVRAWLAARRDIVSEPARQAG